MNKTNTSWKKLFNYHFQIKKSILASLWTNNLTQKFKIWHFFQASLEVVFPPEIQGMGEFKAGPGDVARLAIKVRAFPEAELEWFKLEGEGEEAKQEKVDPKEKKFAK